MTDSQESGSESTTIFDAVDRFYPDSEPQPEPTEPAEKEAEAIEDESDNAVEADSSLPAESEAEVEDDEVVYDQPDDFAKFDYDDEEKLYSFRSNGKKIKANIETLIRNYREGQKITEVTEKLSKERKGVFEKAQAKQLELLKSQSDKYQSLAEKLEQVIADKESVIDWDELRKDDPSEYLRLKEEQEKRKEALAESQAELADKIATQRAETIAAEAARLKEVMAWPSDKDAQKDIEAARQYVASKGVTDQELTQLIDHRFWAMVMDAAKYQDLVAKSKAKKESKTPPKSVKSKRSDSGDKKPQKSAAEIFYGTA